jgi:hypothetical protein
MDLVCVAYDLKRLHKLITPANQKPKLRSLPNQRRQRSVSSLIVAWHSNEFLREAELEEPVERAAAFRIR